MLPPSISDPDATPRTRRRLVRRPAPAPDGPAPPPQGAPQEPRLLRLAAACPRCNTHPAMRVTAAGVGALAALDAGEQVGTYQCQRRGCGAVYDILAGAIQRAY